MFLKIQTPQTLKYGMTDLKYMVTHLSRQTFIMSFLSAKANQYYSSVKQYEIAKRVVSLWNYLFQLR